MRVSQAQRARSGSGSRSTRGTGQGGKEFRLPSSRGPVQRAEVAAPSGVGNIDVIVALQSVPGPDDERRQAVESGVQILDLLDQLKVGLLSGGVSSGDLKTLKRVIEQQQKLENDPELADVLKQIDLRARVELAKLKGNAA